VRPAVLALRLLFVRVRKLETIRRKLLFAKLSVRRDNLTTPGFESSRCVKCHLSSQFRQKA
jgi:hypothetical protein